MRATMLGEAGGVSPCCFATCNEGKFLCLTCRGGWPHVACSVAADRA